MSRSGWTLIETLVSVGVIGILVALLVPVIGRARERAGETRHVAYSRQCAELVLGWTVEHADTFPSARPDVVYPTDAEGVGGVSIGSDAGARWRTADLWPGVVLGRSGMLEWAEVLFAGRFDSGVPHQVLAPHFMLSNSFVADPRLWSSVDSTTMSSDVLMQFLRDVRLTEVSSPSRKVMIYDRGLYYLRRREEGLLYGLPDVRTPMSFADGHGAATPISGVAPPAHNPLNDTSTANVAIHNTPNGVHGVDYR
jgi:hypothetical protein